MTGVLKELWGTDMNNLLPDPRWFLPAVLLYSLLVASVCGAEDTSHKKDKECEKLLKAKQQIEALLGDDNGVTVEVYGCEDKEQKDGNKD